MDDVKRCKHNRNFCMDCHAPAEAISTGHPDAGRVYAAAYEAVKKDFDAQRLRADTAEAERNQLLNDPNNVFKKMCDMALKQRDESQAKLTAAEQRIAELVEYVESALFRLETFIEAEREMAIPSMEVLRDAAQRQLTALSAASPVTINQQGEAPCDHNYHLGECTKCGAISATE